MQIKMVDYTNPEAPKRFTQSLRETGFGVLDNHPIDTQLIFDVYKEWEQFFASEAKFNYTFDKQRQDGYFPYRSENAKNNAAKDLKEFFHVYDWGVYPKELSQKTKALNQQLTEIASDLLQWIEQNTPSEIKQDFSMPLSDMIRDSQRSLFRIIHYPALEQGEYQAGSIRAAAHEDINLITVLPAATAPGLQVKDIHGKWHDVACDPGMLVVNVGDMLQMCSQGYYPATTHRVVNPTGEFSQSARLSMPLFLHPRDEVALSKQHTANSYRLERLQEIGLM